MKILRIIMLTAITALYLLSCESPLEPVDSLWHSVISLTDYYCNDLQCDSDGNVYIASGNRLYLFNGSDLEKYAEFENYNVVTLFTMEGGEFVCLDCSRYTDYGTDPGLYHNIDGVWSQIELPVDIKVISDFDVISDECYLMSGQTEDSENRFYRYYNGSWVICEIPNDCYVSASVVSSDDVIYTFARNYNPVMHEYYDWFLLISNDNGDSWIKESVSFDYPQFELMGFGNEFDVFSEDVATCEGNILYAVAYISVNDKLYYSVIKREGEPGDGTWNPEVIVPGQSPDSGTLNAVAFSNSESGITTGYESSIVYEGNGVWRKELFDFDLRYLRASSTGAYWAICRDKLYYHP